ncbi:MAG: hypothetical protein OIF51_08925 [Cellvibrionaceae bacterium]|nr:hypothetical protein [Cellvibrionaceae bacterium]
MTDTPTEQWPREIWAFQIDHDQHEMSGAYVTSEHATLPRYEGDTERGRPVKRYVDADILESAERYYRVKLEEQRGKLKALHDHIDSNIKGMN